MTTHPNQCQRVLQRLQRGPATSWELQQLGICCHTKRISELRRQGHEIRTSERRQAGKRVVTYRLLGGSLELPFLPPVGDSGASERPGSGLEAKNA